MESMENRTAISNEEIIAALISCGSIAQAAEQLNMSPRTIYDRMGYRDFKAAYSAAKADIVRQAVLTMGRNLAAAVDVITGIMNDDSNPATTRIQAARMIIDNAWKFTDRISAADEYTAEKATDPQEFNPAKW